MRSAPPSPTIVGMWITNLISEIPAKGNGNRAAPRRAGFEAAQTLAVASQIALLCPSGMDVWMQRELAGDSGRPRRRWAR
jgi:hypothetical protein